jgi:uncharacterized membrane-anchored protein YitT (DUF2179 family)
VTGAAPPREVPPHTGADDLFALAVGVHLTALGLYLVHASGTVTGGTAALSLLLSYATTVPFEVLFVVVIAPFFALGLATKGRDFLLRSVVCVAGTSVLTALHSEWLDLAAMPRVYGVVTGNLLIGFGLLAVIRHSASLGGFTILGVILQERAGLRAGYVQLALDVLVVLASFFVADLRTVLLSILGAVVLDLFIAFNHRPGRYRSS